MKLREITGLPVGITRPQGNPAARDRTPGPTATPLPAGTTGVPRGMTGPTGITQHAGPRPRGNTGLATGGHGGDGPHGEIRGPPRAPRPIAALFFGKSRNPRGSHFLGFPAHTCGPTGEYVLPQNT